MMSDFTPIAFGSFGRIRAFSGREPVSTSLENALCLAADAKEKTSC
jgi:hypothetical protein